MFWCDGLTFSVAWAGRDFISEPCRPILCDSIGGLEWMRRRRAKAAVTLGTRGGALIPQATTNLQTSYTKTVKQAINKTATKDIPQDIVSWIITSFFMQKVGISKIGGGLSVTSHHVGEAKEEILQESIRVYSITISISLHQYESALWIEVCKTNHQQDAWVRELQIP